MTSKLGKKLKQYQLSGLQHILGDTSAAITGNLLNGLTLSGWCPLEKNHFVFYVILMRAALESGGKELLNIAKSGSIPANCLRHTLA